MPVPPLELPEILECVLQHLDFKSLVAAAQVNSLWAEEATNCIWRGDYRASRCPSSVRLRKLADSPKERRDWYSKKIRNLKLEKRDDWGYGSVLPIMEIVRQKGFNFPNLKSLVMDIGSENMGEKEMAQFLRPSLLCLELFGGYYTKWFLEQIKTNAPSLRSLLLDNGLINVDPSTNASMEKDLIHFLKEMPSIKHLELMVGWRPLLTQKIMSYLMFRSGLEMLRIKTELRFSTVQMALSTNPDLVVFPHLRSLDLCAEDRVWRLILPMLKRLQCADIVVTDCHSPVDILHGMSSCSQLEELSFYWDDGELTGASVLDLASHCPMLRRIYFGSDDGYLVEISDDMIETLASRLVHLDELTFPSLIDVRLTSKSLASFARHCPRLTRLDMPVDVEFIELDNEPEQLHFPLLETLGLGLITARHMALRKDFLAWVERIIQVLKERFPCLMIFNFSPTPPYDEDSDPSIRRVKEHLLQMMKFTFRRLWSVNFDLKSRLIESVPGSRYNPFS